MSLAKAHLQRLSARQLDSAVLNDNPNATEYELMLVKLHSDINRLSGIKAVEGRIPIKLEILPEYDAWCEGVMAADSTRQDDVFVTVFAWYLDVGNFNRALSMAEFIITHNLVLPERFNRDPATFLIDSLVEHAASPHGVSLPILLQAETLINGLDMHDKPAAKFFKVLGDAYAAENDPVHAVEYYLRAETRSPGIGAKTALKKQQKRLLEQPVL